MVANGPQILLIDDDPVFGKIMLSAAQQFNMVLRYYGSLEELGFVAKLANFDAIVCDFYLEAFTGKEIAAYVAALLDDTPVVMISGSDLTELPLEEWPGCVRGFISKRNPPWVILRQALKLCGIPYQAVPRRASTSIDPKQHNYDLDGFAEAVTPMTVKKWQPVNNRP